MNFSKNPFIGSNNVSKTTSTINTSNTYGRANVNDIKQNMQNISRSQNAQARELVQKKEEELKMKHEAFADSQRMFNPNKTNHNSQVQAQNNLLRGFKNGR